LRFQMRERKTRQMVLSKKLLSLAGYHGEHISLDVSGASCYSLVCSIVLSA
jgi:hypothetical protein